jgi:hypothetical protein
VPRPGSRPSTSIITIGSASLEITWCSICHAITKIMAVGAVSSNYTDYAWGLLDLIEDLHYDWHDRMEGK